MPTMGNSVGQPARYIWISKAFEESCCVFEGKVLHNESNGIGRLGRLAIRHLIKLNLNLP